MVLKKIRCTSYYRDRSLPCTCSSERLPDWCTCTWIPVQGRVSCVCVHVVWRLTKPNHGFSGNMEQVFCVRYNVTLFTAKSIYHRKWRAESTNPFTKNTVADTGDSTFILSLNNPASTEQLGGLCASTISCLLYKLKYRAICLFFSSQIPQSIVFERVVYISDHSASLPAVWTNVLSFTEEFLDGR